MENVLALTRTFLEANPPAEVPDRVLRERRFDAGLAFPHFDQGCGGLGADPRATVAVEQLFLEAGAVDWADGNVIGLGMAAPSIHEFGTPDQRELLRPLFSSEHIWCQLFSEPEAGSDLASVRTRATRDGDCWITEGQKVWTTLGHVARWGLLLARTDPDAAKHNGLTYFLLDMSLPGVVVTPLRQMTGEAEFNEVHLDGVRVPDAARLGPVDGGWRVAMTTLMNERTSLPEVAANPGSGPIGRAEVALRAGLEGGRLLSAHRDRFLELWVRAEVNRLTGMRSQQLAERGTPGPEGSIGKIAMAETNQAIFELIVELLGPEGLLIDDYDEIRPEVASVHGGADLRKAFLRTRANSIEGGTSEILRNVVGERVLGLPREPRP